MEGEGDGEWVEGRGVGKVVGGWWGEGRGAKAFDEG